MKHFTFANGDPIPAIGFGTWLVDPDEVGNVIHAAIEAGYRHIDCAAVYRNEKGVGEGLNRVFNKGLVKREDLFITSKLWNSAHLPDDVPKALQQTLEDLQLDYLDLYLMHWPVALRPGTRFPETADEFLSPEEAPLEQTWEAMEAQVDAGKCRHIGVSNFYFKNLNKILRSARHKPEVNQVELHPFLTQQPLLDFCRENHIHVTAYSPLGSSFRKERGPDGATPFDLEIVKEIAERHNKTVAQVILAWAVNRGTSAIPRSTNPDRMRQNLAAADIQLSAQEVEAISACDRNHRFIDGSTWTFEGSPYSLDDLWG